MFDITVNINRLGTYELNKGKWAAFIFLPRQSPDGKWIIPEPPPAWINIFNKDKTELIRKCSRPNLGAMFRNPKVEYAVFIKTGYPCHSVFYGTFKVTDIKNEGMECLYKRIKTEIDPVKWAL